MILLSSLAKEESESEGKETLGEVCSSSGNTRTLAHTVTDKHVFNFTCLFA